MNGKKILKICIAIIFAFNMCFTNVFAKIEETKEIDNDVVLLDTSGTAIKQRVIYTLFIYWAMLNNMATNLITSGYDKAMEVAESVFALSNLYTDAQKKVFENVADDVIEKNPSLTLDDSFKLNSTQMQQLQNVFAEGNYKDNSALLNNMVTYTIDSDNNNYINLNTDIFNYQFKYILNKSLNCIYVYPNRYRIFITFDSNYGGVCYNPNNLLYDIYYKSSSYGYGFILYDELGKCLDSNVNIYLNNINFDFIDKSILELYYSSNDLSKYLYKSQNENKYLCLVLDLNVSARVNGMNHPNTNKVYLPIMYNSKGLGLTYFTTYLNNYSKTYTDYTSVTIDKEMSSVIESYNTSTSISIPMTPTVNSGSTTGMTEDEIKAYINSLLGSYDLDKPNDSENDNSNDDTNNNENVQATNNIFDLLKSWDIVNKLNELINSIKDLPSSIATNISNLFIPKENYWNELFEDNEDFFKAKFGILMVPLIPIEKIIDLFNYTDDVNSTIHIPDIYAPGTQYILFPESDLVLSDMIQKAKLNDLYNLYKIFINFVISLSLINLAYKKWRSIVK